MKSISRRLTIALLASALVASIAAGEVVYVRLHRDYTRQFDAALIAKARAIATLLLENKQDLELNFADEIMPEFESGRRQEYFQVWRTDGTVLERSHSLGDATDLPRIEGDPEDPGVADLVLPDGRNGRAAGFTATLDPGHADEDRDAARPLRAHVVVARSREDLDAALRRVRRALFAALAVLSILVALLGALLVRRGLRPLSDLGRSVAAIDADHLSARVSDVGLPRELLPFAGKLNELLSRLEDAFSRERRSSGNLAHELRTPLAELRSATEMAQRWPDDPQIVRQALDTAADVSQRMTNLVGALLRLSRAGSGAVPLEREPIELGKLTHELLAAAADAAATRALTLESHVPEGLVLRTDRELLTLALRNLVENAVGFADEGSTVRCDAAEAATGGDGAVITWTLTNRAAGVQATDVPHFGEPYWRKDPARRDTGHAGLGLALVATIARALGGELRFEYDGAIRARLRVLKVAPGRDSRTPAAPR